MTDLISRADAIEAVCEDWCGHGYSKCPHKPQRMCDGCDTIVVLQSLPSADAVSRDVHVCIVNELVKRIEELKADSVKVVRCKDCKWYMLTDHNETEVCTNKQWDISMAIYPIISADGFCSYGERREK